MAPEELPNIALTLQSILNVLLDIKARMIDNDAMSKEAHSWMKEEHDMKEQFKAQFNAAIPLAPGNNVGSVVFPTVGNTNAAGFPAAPDFGELNKTLKEIFGDETEEDKKVRAEAMKKIALGEMDFKEIMHVARDMIKMNKEEKKEFRDNIIKRNPRREYKVEEEPDTKAETPKEEG